MQGNRAVIAVRFQSEQVNVIKDRDRRNVIEGADSGVDHVDSLTDVWTFARDVASRNPNWALIAKTQQRILGIEPQCDTTG